MNADLLQSALAASQKGLNYAIATIIETTGKGTPRKPGAKMIVYEDGSLFGTIGGGTHEKKTQLECLQAIKKKKTKILSFDCTGKDKDSICGGQYKVFIDPVLAPKTLIICGAGHIALPLSIIAKMLAYRVVILDDRKEFTNKKRFPHADRLIEGNQAQTLKKLKIEKNTHIMIVTHQHSHDLDCLKAVIDSPAGYIGVIASQSKKTKFLTELKKKGYTPKTLKKIDIPAGIDLGAQTPQEIAVSIASKLITINNAQFIGTEKFKK